MCIFSMLIGPFVCVPSRLRLLATGSVELDGEACLTRIRNGFIDGQVTPDVGILQHDRAENLLALSQTGPSHLTRAASIPGIGTIKSHELQFRVVHEKASGRRRIP